MRDGSARRLRRPLFWARALACPASLVLSGAACGGNVVVNPPSATGAGAATTASSGHGGATGASTASSTGPGGGGQDGGCSPVYMPPDMPQKVCFQSTYCPAANSQSARDQINAAGGLCDLGMSPCCKQPVIDQVVCGSPVSSGDCCYVVLVATHACP